MTFAKDILVVDLELTGNDPEVCLPIQLSAILLDKETLEEKDSFSSYIKNDLSQAMPEALAMNGITEADLAEAPTPAEVATKFNQQFGENVLLASWVEYLDRRILSQLLRQAGLSLKTYDYHYLDIWPIAYIHLLKNGYEGSLKSEAMFTAFGLPPRQSHDALDDCRRAATILRQIIKA